MTGKELSMIARSLMMDNLSSTHLDEHVVPHINVLIAELFAENNHLRRFKDKDVLYDIPVITDLDEKLFYENEMLYNVMPKGLAARFLQDEDDRSRYTMLQTEYMNARSQVMPVVFSED